MLTLAIPNGREFSDALRILTHVRVPKRLGAVAVISRPHCRPVRGHPFGTWRYYGGIDVLVVPSACPFPPAMRNAIIDSLKTSHVLFLDDDVVPAPDLVEQAANLSNSFPDTVFQGPPYLAANPEHFLSRMESRLYERGFTTYTTSDGKVSILDARILLMPTSIARTHRFDASLVYGGEGRDLARRLAENLVSMRIAPQLRVSHINRTSLIGLLKQKRVHGNGRGQHLRDHGPGAGGWGEYLIQYSRRHFLDPAISALLGRVPAHEAAYVLLTNAFFWICVLETAIVGTGGRDRRRSSPTSTVQHDS